MQAQRTAPFARSPEWARPVMTFEFLTSAPVAAEVKVTSDPSPHRWKVFLTILCNPLPRGEGVGRARRCGASTYQNRVFPRLPGEADHATSIREVLLPFFLITDHSNLGRTINSTCSGVAGPRGCA